MAQKSPQRTSNLLTALVYIVIMIAILAAANYLANAHNLSHDFTLSKKFTLSDQTEKIAKNLKQDVGITYWGQPQNFQQAKDLLDRYKNLSSKIDVHYNDADKMRLQAQAAGVKNYGTIFVEVGNKKEEAKGLTEEEITGALVRSLKGGDRTVCFTLGSEENSIDDTGNAGYSKAKELIERNNYKTQTVKMLPKPEIPKECTILVVGGPKRDFVQQEVDALKAYVENGGRALFLFDPPFKLANDEIDANEAFMGVLAGWGVMPQKNVVLDLSGTGQIFGAGPQYPLVDSYESHAIVSTMKEVPTLFPLTRSLDIKTGEKAKVEKLFSTSDDSVATANLSSPEVKLTKQDQKGPLLLGVAGTLTDAKENGPGMFVVVGTSGWIANGFLGFNGNRNLFLNMLNWLSSDTDLISIRPKEPDDRPLNMNQRQVSMMFYSSVVGFPLLIIAAGLGVWWKRR
ncbi:MAG TPA: GldG family protein [Bryobacteraceae bacterium]|jgi:ABC-type uncharacterized transport system involved in gliding motility auxiliary subunit